MHRFVSLLALSAVVGTATAQSTIVIPNGLAAAEGGTSNLFPWGRGGSGLRIQNIYDSSHFTAQGITAPILITGLKWRPNTLVALVASSYTAGCTVQLSTSPLDQAAASATFANNQGANLTTCYSGVVSWGAQAGGAGPLPFGISIPFTTNFVYDPSAGDLNIESDLPIQTFTGSAPSLDVQAVAPLASRVFRSSGYVNGGPNLTGTIGLSHGVVVEVSYIPLQLTTTFAHNNGGAVGGSVYFDLDVTNPAGITINRLDVNLLSIANTLGAIEVYTCPTTRTGNQTIAGAWSLVGSGAVTSAGPGLHSVVALNSPIPLTFGTVGMALKAVSVSHAYTGTTSPPPVFSNPHLTLTVGDASNVAFAAPLLTPRAVNCQIYYDLGAVGAAATRSDYGSGCGPATSFYEYFPTAPSFDLNNSAMTLTRTNPGYSVAPGGTFFPPTVLATVLPLSDESEVLTPLLTTPFPYDGGSATRLMVCSNGYVSVAAGNGVAFFPSVPAMLTAPQTAWWCWHDFNPTGSSGRVKFEEIPPHVHITWDGVFDFAAGASSASRFQMQFNTATGRVIFAWQTMSALHYDYLVGFSPGGPSATPGNRDLSVQLPLTFSVGGFDQLLSLSASTRPIPGNSIDLVTSNNNPATIFGAILLGLSQFPNGVSLFPQMSGCFQYTDGAITLPLFFGGAPIQTTSFPVPNAPGLHVFAQAAVFCPAANLTLLGALSSNGLDLGIGNY